MRFIILITAYLALIGAANAQAIQQTKSGGEDKFRQLDEDWPTPTDVRLASGAPGPEYWQQDVDYEIKVTLDEAERSASGFESVHYTNNSPHTLSYLWLQLDQNRFKENSLDNLSRTDSDDDRISYHAVRRAQAIKDLQGGYKISNVSTKMGAPLNYKITDTNMRIDLPRPLKPGASFDFQMDFAFNIYDTRTIGGRGGYECFEKEDEDGNCIFLMSQWFPRLHAYSDYEGWHNKAFLGSGEFTLEFGDYHVELTVPSDHIVSSTGVLKNAKRVLSAQQYERYEAIKSSDEPKFIVTPQEARENEKTVEQGSATWVFDANNVRDFAWASSRKFIWDGMNVKQDNVSGGEDVLAMSFYPNAAEPLWSAYSSKAVAHTIKVYSRFSFAYPYPVAQSVNGPVGGMEYPMITFNGPRPSKDEDGNLTYSRNTKYGLIGVIIHEVGHIYFPMTVNSDERQWTWMDEGINTFLEFVAEKEWEEDFPARRGEPRNIIGYMKSSRQVPIMTQSDSILQFGNNAYGKPATALNILRETVLGREAFDRAFIEYSQRWKFKRPTPYDFFRTMEEASGTDLDWFWRGWFYSTDHVDIAITKVTEGTLDTLDPDVEKELEREEYSDEPLSLSIERNRTIEKAVDRDPSLLDFYNENDKFSVAEKDRESFKTKTEALEDWEKELLASKSKFYYVTFSNEGGLVMPIILEISLESGKKELIRIPAEIWRRNSKTVTKMLIVDEPIVSLELDPRWETADVDTSNNHFPAKAHPSRLELYKRKTSESLMERFDMKVEPTGLATSIIEKTADEDEAE